MQEIHSYSQLQEALKQKLQVVFFSSHACSVCTVDLPEVEKICDRYQVPLLQVKVEEVPGSSRPEQCLFFARSACFLQEQRNRQTSPFH